MKLKIVDTTMRDGEQMAGKALKADQKIMIAKLLDSIGIYQIEAGIPAMGGEEKKSVERIASLGLKSRISSWNRLNTTDIALSMECGVDNIHLSVPSSDIQIIYKLKKSREWVIDNLRRCVALCRDKGFPVTIGLEDASRADREFIFQLLEYAVSEGVRVVRYADTVGILNRRKTFEEFHAIRSKYDIQLEIHAHNDFGLAVPNSLAAVQAGAEFVSCTAGGIGERAGNCSLLEFVKAAVMFINQCNDFDLEQIKEVQKEILMVMRH
jgi:homocitrate synthase NifV